MTPTQLDCDYERELARLRVALDTIDWLLHVNRRGQPAKLDHSVAACRAAVELARAALGPEWFAMRHIPS